MILIKNFLLKKMESLNFGDEEIFSEAEDTLGSGWSIYDTYAFPNVKVTMIGKIESQQDFDNFIRGWKELYEKNERFTLTFDTTRVGMVSMKYALKMRSFIRELKRDYPRLLEKSYISTNSRWVRFLLKIIFFMEKPVADVVITNESDGTSTIVKC